MFFPAGRRVVPNVAAHAASRSMILRVAGPQFAQVSGSGTAAIINFSPPPGPGDVVYVWQARLLGIGALATGGYSEIVNGGSPDNLTLIVWRKRMGTTPDTSVVSVVNTFGRSIVMGAIILRNVDAATPEDVAATTVNNEVPPITTVTANTWILALYGAVGINFMNITSPPAGYGNFSALSGTAVTGGNVLAAAGSTRLLATAGTEDPGNYSHDGSFSIGHTVAVRRG